MEKLLSVGMQEGGGPAGLGGGDMASLREQAASLWKMLDDMAESDPQAYAKFIEQQAVAAREAAPVNQTPVAHAVVLQPRQTSADLVAIHVWPAPDEVCPMPKVDDQPILTTTSQWTGMRISCCPVKPPATWQAPSSCSTAVAHHHCAVNRRLLRLAAANQPPELRGLLHEAVCQWAEVNKGESLQHQPRQLQVNSSLPGIKDATSGSQPAGAAPPPPQAEPATIKVPGMQQAPVSSKPVAPAKKKGPLIEELS